MKVGQTASVPDSLVHLGVEEKVKEEEEAESGNTTFPLYKWAFCNDGCTRGRTVEVTKNIRIHYLEKRRINSWNLAGRPVIVNDKQREKTTASPFISSSELIYGVMWLFIYFIIFRDIHEDNYVFVLFALCYTGYVCLLASLDHFWKNISLLWHIISWINVSYRFKTG